MKIQIAYRESIDLAERIRGHKRRGAERILIKVGLTEAEAAGLVALHLGRGDRVIGPERQIAKTIDNFLSNNTERRYDFFNYRELSQRD